MWAEYPRAGVNDGKLGRDFVSVVRGHGDVGLTQGEGSVSRTSIATC